MTVLIRGSILVRKDSVSFFRGRILQIHPKKTLLTSTRKNKVKYYSEYSPLGSCLHLLSYLVLFSQCFHTVTENQSFPCRVTKDTSESGSLSHGDPVRKALVRACFPRESNWR